MSFEYSKISGIVNIKYINTNTNEYITNFESYLHLDIGHYTYEVKTTDRYKRIKQKLIVLLVKLIFLQLMLNIYAFS